jgi:hypothetical protein
MDSTKRIGAEKVADDGFNALADRVLRGRRQVMVYVAGPFRADTPWGVELHVRRAEERAYMLAARGVGYVCPHLNGRFFDKTATDEYWLEMTMEQMRRCDVVWADVRMGSEARRGSLRRRDVRRSR